MRSTVGFRLAKCASTWLHRGLGVGHLIVDLATARVSRLALAHQAGQWLAGDAHQLGNQQPGDHAAVAIGEIAEVVMRAHFAAIDGVFETHALLDEGVAGLALHGDTASLFDDVDGVPGQAWIVNDFFARLVGKEGGSQQANDVVALDELSAFIEEEAAVEVAIPGDAHVGAVGDDRFGGGRAVFGQQRVGNAVREAAVRLVVNLDELDGNVRVP